MRGRGEEAAARAAGVRGRLAVVRNGVDLRRFRPAGEAERAAARRALGVPERARLAVCVGRITRQKGQDRLLAAWAEVRAACPSALLALVGDGDLRDRLRARGVPGVLFPGAADDVRPWYAAADVAVLPSRWEGLPLAALEAMATGRSLVATAIPGLCEVVAADTGATVVPGDTTGLARALARRLADPALARREGRPQPGTPKATTSPRRSTPSPRSPCAPPIRRGRPPPSADWPGTATRRADSSRISSGRARRGRRSTGACG
ncbi:glycosyltransferase family 4 protein [Thermocatellispora tengchongensis]|uniref:glycosyltransferase family 4 protein n=1 Tax=Thermocatellispora tengchongensis TaxID=1073253 RepID=UPI0036291E0E